MLEPGFLWTWGLACVCVSELSFVFFCLNGWLGFGMFGSNMGELASPEFHFWKSMFCGLPQGLNFIFGNEVFVLSERGWAIVGVRVPGSMGGGLGNWLMEGVGFGWWDLLCMCS